MPPDSTTAVVPDRDGATRPESSAATPTAPAPSTKSLARSISSIIASATSSSSTVTTSSSQRPMSGRVIRPGCLTAMPSASVVMAPAATDWFAYGAQDSICTPMTFTPGSARLTAMAMPLASPPPPTGTITRCSSGMSSTSSRPSVACPAMIAGSSNGWMKAIPASAARASAEAMAASTPSPPCSTVAP